ncbi:hypothetical protein Tco_0986458 [Tanacetum coccineum]
MTMRTKPDVDTLSIDDLYNNLRVFEAILLELYMLKDHPLKNIEERGIFDSGCSRHMTGNKDHLDDFKECKWGICYLWR